MQLMARVPKTKPVKSIVELGCCLLEGPLDNGPIYTNALNIRDATDIEVDVTFVRGGTATGMIITMEAAHADIGPWFAVMEVNASGDAIPLTVTRTTSISENFSLVYSVVVHQFVRFGFAGVTGTVDDTVSVLVSKIAN